jgi:hypothetical protein
LVINEEQENHEVTVPMKLPAVLSRVNVSTLERLPTNNDSNIPSQFQGSITPMEQKQTLTMAGKPEPIPGQNKSKREYNTALSTLNNEV